MIHSIGTSYRPEHPVQVAATRADRTGQRGRAKVSRPARPRSSRWQCAYGCSRGKYPETPLPADRTGQRDATEDQPAEAIRHRRNAPSCRIQRVLSSVVSVRGRGRGSLVVAAVLTAACGWSAIALHGLAQQAGTTSWLAWGAPIIVDGPLFQSAIALVVLKRRAKNRIHVEPRFRRFYWWTLAASELVSLIGNGAHAAKVPVTPTIAAVIAGAAPVAAMAVMHGFTILLEVPRKPEPTAQAVNSETTASTGHFDTFQEPSPAVSLGDAVASPAVSYPSPENPGGDAEETPPVSYPSPGDGRGDAEPVSEETTERPEDRDAAIWAMHLEGKPLREIAETMDLSKGYVGKILTRLKVEHGTPPADDGTEVMLQVVR
ncbi:DUF2637 domain-containing protein [Nocardia sp. NPDC046763]|uniref:DUF2637 domain-containing protein n=1 Tax=Nocardia sp. NPDC046763 TaxID=3155256 RepID=UPI00340A62CE